MGKSVLRTLTGSQITLAAADPRRLFGLNFADVISGERSLLDWTTKQSNLLPFMSGVALDYYGTLWGPIGTRLPASFAVTNMVFTLAFVAYLDVTVPAGTQISASGINFATDIDLIISAGTTTGTVTATCTTVGAIGNNFLSG